MSQIPFGWETTADEAIAGISLDGMRAVVTGASSGIGAEDCTGAGISRR